MMGAPVSHALGRVAAAVRAGLTRVPRPVLLAGLLLTIPAFYLQLVQLHGWGSAAYLLAGLLLARDATGTPRARRGRRVRAGDLFIALGSLASALPAGAPWGRIEWLLRLGFCAVVFFRLVQLLLRLAGPHHLLTVMVCGAALLAAAGGGFYWLEPRVTSYADGLWLAFITAATVGYGDLVPSVPASRILAVFVVLLGYAIFTLVTASIAAMFVDQEEKQAQRQLHADIRALRAELAALRTQQPRGPP